MKVAKLISVTIVIEIITFRNILSHAFQVELGNAFRNPRMKRSNGNGYENFIKTHTRIFKN